MLTCIVMCDAPCVWWLAAVPFPKRWNSSWRCGAWTVRVWIAAVPSCANLQDGGPCCTSILFVFAFVTLSACFSASSSRRRDCLGEELPTAAYEEIQRFILEKLRSFPTSISQDESILRSGPTTNKLGFTLRLSPNERCALHRCRQYNRSLTRCVRLQVRHQVSPDAQASAC